MHLMKLTFDEALKRFPQEVEQLVKKLRKSKSKENSRPAADLEFEINYCISMSGSIMNGVEFLDRMMSGTPPEPKKEPDTVDGRVADFLPRCMCGLTGKVGRWYGTESIANPPELEEKARKDFEIQINREKEIKATRAAMTDEEKAEEDALIIEQLTGMGGFVGIRMSKIGDL